ncbi:MAG TPA: GspE/PulE family protein [Candidatus Sumerlaeota bacterium]|nr:MAG: Type II secretion system protein E [candidate division BRC1 bacterium ADurb.Bin183]HOE63754.1 GspE/PulE family protein [Candidatus Sumerlaeota bacterium]HON49481.1 GspE/PulE family protein [Candidatus Sumerlaeota bacterium]HOR64630.1 GspE/PulE family protein [Candidatus Sumerlaeota bacterium]HPL74356.1 GspE/PulE family protein [Candidatus Sumerlaeota bacterium]
MLELFENMIKAEQVSRRDVDLFIAGWNGSEKQPDEEDVLRWLAAEYGIRFSELQDIEPDRELLSLFPARVLLKHLLLPLRRTRNAIEVATCRLFATEGLDTLKLISGTKLTPVLATTEAIQREMKKHLGVGADTLDTLEDENTIQIINTGDEENIDLSEAAEDASIIRFVNQVLTDAIDLRATDIHMEPFEDEMRIRYRIDGVLQEVSVPPQIKKFQPAIVSRVKILSHLDIAEKRLPQDGRIKVRIAEREIDIRVSLIPMLYGEGVVLRLLPQESTLRGLPELKMAEREERLFRRMLAMPHGIILVTGPTGSGKTTTLYSALNEINDSIRKIITIEDPVEYHMKGVNQIQIHEKAGLTFARGLRSILRHDPDVILVGEIRDSETAQIAIQASLTGHLVFSTLHTNDAPGALTRLVDMGAEPYLVTSALEGVLAQRLVRTLCRECRVEDLSVAAQTFKSEIGLGGDTPVYKAAGCEICRNTGFFGRRAIFEMLIMNENICRLVLESRSTGEIREAARLEGMRSLSEDGWRLVSEGVTTIDEVLRVTKDVRKGENGYEKSVLQVKAS